MMSVLKHGRSLDLATELNSLEANPDSRKAILSQLCVLAYVFVKSNAILASVLRPSGIGDGQSWEQAIEFLSGKGLLSAYRAEDGQLFLGFGTATRTDTHRPSFSGSALQDAIIEWTVESGCFNDIFYCAVRLLENAGSLCNDYRDFPNYRHIMGLMDLFQILAYDHHKSLQADVILAFGVMLLTRAT